MSRMKILAVAAALVCGSPVLAAAQSDESAGVVTTVPMMLLGLVIRRYLVTGLTMGAVKE